MFEFETNLLIVVRRVRDGRLDGRVRGPTAVPSETMTTTYKQWQARCTFCSGSKQYAARHGRRPQVQ